MRSTSHLALASVWLAMIVSLPATSSAQTATGQITGTVRDSTGAVMSDVKVSVTNQQTGLTRQTTTGDNGDYVIPLLPVGVYVVTGEKAGFKLAVNSDVALTVDQIQRVDIVLDAGNVTETVEVQASAQVLDTGSASVGHTITEKQVTDLPLNGRNFLQLLFLGAGAVETAGEQGGMRQGVGNAISIMGARPTSNNFMIDGTANIDTSIGTPAAVLSVDAIQEFKEQTTTYSAEYGFSSNQINLVSKTGTNVFHGTGFGFFRNDGWDARNFFDDKTTEAPKLDQKQFGFVVGGPVMLPGYNGRNRTFFLVNYEGTRIDRGATSFYTVPTQQELTGRFDTTIIDPLTGQPFPNNTIPQSRFSQLAQLAIRNNWFPAPNSTAAQGNFQDVRTFPQVQDQFTIRGDQDLAKLGRVFVRYTNTSYENTATSNMIAAGDRVFAQDTKNWQVSHSWPIRNTVVNQFRMGHVEARADQHGIPCPQADVDFLDVTGVFTNVPDDQRECPSIGMNGYAGTGGAINAYTASNQPMWDISNTTTWVKGSHTLNFGFNYRRWWLQRDLATGFLGNYAYNVGFTGNVVADMLLGYYSGVGVFQPAAYSVPGAAGNPREFNFQYFAPYFQDDWRVSSKLTVNLGLRWDYRNVPYETNDRMAWRNVDFAPGGLLVADQSLVDGGIVDGAYYQYAGRRSPENPDRFKAFAPRFGFAWRPIGEQTVIRGGYGVFFDSAEGREIDGAADVYPYVSRGNYTQSVGQPTPLQTSDALFPSFAAPGVATPAANTFLAVSQSPLPRNPYVQQWSLGVQREVFPRTSHGDQLHRHARFQSADAAEHRAGAPVRPGQPAVGRRAEAVPELRHLHRQQLERPVELQRAEHQARASVRQLDPDVRVYVGEEHRLEVGRRRHRRQRVQRMAGLPQQPRPGARLRPVGLRRRPSARRQLRLQPAVRQRGEVRLRCDRREERRGRRLAGERHLYLAARVPADDHGRGRRRSQRHVRHQPRRSGRRSEQRRADGDPVVQRGRLRAAGGRRARQSRAQYRTRTRREQPGFRPVQELRDLPRCPGPVQVRVVQLLQPYAVRQREHEPLGRQLRRGDVGASGPHQPAGYEVDLLSQGCQRKLPTSNTQLPRNPATAGARILGSWELGVGS